MSFAISGLSHLGFIAQEIEKVLPQMVHDDEESGLKTVGYIGIIPVLVEAIKEQQKEPICMIM